MTERKFEGQTDYLLLFAVIALVGIGITMSYSASAVFAADRYDNPYYFLKKTLMFAGIGFFFMALAARLPYYHYKKLVYPMLIVAILLCIAVFIPGFGKTIGGATRWVHLGPVSFQPSEALKIATVVFLAYSLDKKDERLGEFGIGFVFHALFLVFVAMIVLMQRDFGSAMIIVVTGMVMLFVSGMRLRYLLFSLLAAVPAAVWLVMGAGYRLRRIVAFLNPWEDQYGAGFQVIQSLIAFNEGGWFGKGLGQGQQKLFYLPEAHTDFIFSVIGEELGLVIGIFSVIGLFAFFCYRGFKAALSSGDMFGRYLAVGLTTLICLEAVLNVGVVMGMLPPKGMTLPFISYGGSSLVMSLLAVGMLLSVSAYRGGEDR